MKLSELHTGQHGTILKVRGHGGFRKRIVEMGFIKGQTVEVLLNAPLQDPVKYRIMGYEVSLRRQEAEMIEVETNSEVKVSKQGDEALLGRVLGVEGAGTEVVAVADRGHAAAGLFGTLHAHVDGLAGDFGADAVVAVDHKAGD